MTASTPSIQPVALSGAHNYAALERVTYGRAAAEVIAAEADRLNARQVFLMASRTLNRNTSAIRDIEIALGARHGATYDGIPQHTSRTSVSAAAREALASHADLVVAVGGGSVIDAAKMTILCIEHGFVDEHLVGLDPLVVHLDADRKIHRPAYRGPSVRLIAAPSTLNGGEFNGGCLVTDERRKHKETFYHPLLTPRTIIFDPQLASHTPDSLWLGSATRALDHAIEALLSTTATPLSDAVSLSGIRRLVSALRRWKEEPSSVELRAECQLGAWLCSFGLGSHGAQGRVMMGGSHAIGHVLGGTCGVPHYFCTPALMSGLLEWLLPASAQSQSALADALGAPGQPAHQAFDSLVRELGLPGSLDEVGVRREQYDEIGRLSMSEVFLNGSPRPIRTPADVKEILALAQSPRLPASQPAALGRAHESTAVEGVVPARA